jgi:hypothetical protein
MGNDALVTRTNSRTAQDHFNLLQRVLSGDLYPRASSGGAATNEAASLGSSTYRWRKLNALSGEFSVGAIKWRLSYNGLVTPGQGWMLMDGRQVTKANYDAEHASGDWDTYVIASILENKFLPDMTDRYLVGAASVAQDGDSEITSVGNPDNLGLEHVHAVILGNGSSLYDQDNYGYGGQVGGAFNAGSFGVHTGGAKGFTTHIGGGGSNVPPNSYTELWNVNVQPESIAALFYMRVA